MIIAKTAAIIDLGFVGVLLCVINKHKKSCDCKNQFISSFLLNFYSSMSDHDSVSMLQCMNSKIKEPTDL